MPTTCITNCLVCAYSENPADFPTGSFSFTNLDLANATEPYTSTLAVIKKSLKIKNFKLVTNKKTIHNKNSRKNKSRKFYEWSLERIVETNTSDEGIEIDYFPSVSDSGLIQSIKTDIITKLNSINVFEFDYLPTEKDYLKILNTKNEEEYLNLIFINGLWKEEVYINELRNPNLDVYELIAEGQINTE